MLIGAMNHPAQEVVSEIEWMADMGFGFIDLTLEPPRAASWKVDPKAIGRTLTRHRLAIVRSSLRPHTATSDERTRSLPRRFGAMADYATVARSAIKAWAALRPSG